MFIVVFFISIILFAILMYYVDPKNRKINKTEDNTYTRSECGSDVNKKDETKSYTSKAQENVTFGMIQAEKAAKQWLEVMAFSKQRLIERLKNDGFTNEEAVYGANKVYGVKQSVDLENLKDIIDFEKKSAIKITKVILDSYEVTNRLISKRIIINHIEKAGIHSKFGEYAVNNCNVDWCVQAEKLAKHWLETNEISKQKLINYLEHEGFTQEEVVYAVEKVGL